MTRYMYKARDGRGELATGIVQAPTVEAAGAMLRNDGKFAVSLEEARSTLASDRQSGAAQGGSGKISRKEVITFTHQMAAMIDTGVPLSEALDSLSEQAGDEKFQAVLNQVRTRVQAGNTFSSALAEHPKVFPQVMISLVNASEMSGTMGQMLERISMYLTKEYQTAKKVRGALTYPAVMLTMAIGVIIFLLLFVLPRFSAIYEGRGASLPAPTQILISLGDAFANHWYYGLAAVVVSGIGLLVGLRTQKGRRCLDHFKLNLPIIGPLFRGLYLTRGCRTMGTMIQAGVPILEMVEIVRQVTGNVYYEELWDDVQNRLQQGAQFSSAMFASPLIPRSVAQMIASGEKSGRMAPVMQKIADFTEEEFDERVRQATQFIEPAMVCIMGSIIGFVAIAMLLPIFTIGRVVSGG